MLNDNIRGIESFNKLKGNKIILLGNHDTPARQKLYNDCLNTNVLGYATVIKYRKWNFYLSHYPSIVNNDEDWKRFYCLCGHMHTNNKFADWSIGCYHVELDAHGNYPVSVDQIIEDLKRQRLGL